MGSNETLVSERVHIGLFGKTNSGKSSLINAITNQNLSIVSENMGTTTDAVSKTMELLPLGAIVITDTAGYNDKSALGEKRYEKTLKVLEKTDIAILVVQAQDGLTNEDKEFIKKLEEKNIKYFIAYNKSDLVEIPSKCKDNEIYVSALKNINVDKLKEKISEISQLKGNKHELIGDLIKENDRVILVTPIDTSAPKGRLILPQQRVLREVLDSNCVCITVKEGQLKEALKICPNPNLVVTDSQVFGYVNSILPKEIKLTSFSILFARYKGILDIAVNGVKNIEKLKNGDRVLISEGCTHHRQCDDIGTVKLPKLINKYTQKDIKYEFTSGHDFKYDEEIKKYAMIIHCGGCMLNEREVINRYKEAQKQNIPISNYGITIAYINGILERSIEILTRH